MEKQNGAFAATISPSKKKIKIKKTVFISLMLAWPILHLAIFWFYVNYNSVVMAFQNTAGDFTLDNFKAYFEDLNDVNGMAFKSIINSLIGFLVGEFISLPVALVFSYFMFKGVPGSKTFRVIFFLPSIISAVVLTTIYGYLLKSDGPINSLITDMGFSYVPFLLSEKWLLPSCLFYSFWFGRGMDILLISGAMARIPEDIFEYSRLEGVGFVREFVQIVVPLIFETVSSLMIMSAVGVFTGMGQTLLLTPITFEKYTSTIAFYIYYCVNNANVQEYAAAVGFVFTCIGVPIIMLLRRALGTISKNIEF